MSDIKQKRTLDENLSDDLGDIDFSQFREVIARSEVILTPDEEDDIVASFDVDNDLDIDDDFDDLDFGEESAIEPEFENRRIYLSRKRKLSERKTATEKPIGNSILALAEKRRTQATKTNPLVESLLTDDVATEMFNSVVDMLTEFGVSKAVALSSAGDIIGRLLTASDDDVAKDSYIEDVIKKSLSHIENLEITPIQEKVVTLLGTGVANVKENTEEDKTEN